MKKISFGITRLKIVTTAGALVCLTSLISGCGGGRGADVNGADPGITDIPMVFVKRPVPLDNNDNPAQADLSDPTIMNPGADLYVKARATLSTPAVNITGSLTLDDQGVPMGDVKDLDVSYDGKKVVFAMIVPDDDPNDGLDPTWNIWEYNFETGQLQRIISNDSVADRGHDTAPHYLPNNRIIFSSTRQRQSGGVRLDEGKAAFSAVVENTDDNYASVLHIMDPTGDNRRQVSFNQSHDLDPVVLSNGQVMFSRWDRAGNHDEVSLYKMNPDGTGLEMVYGVHNHDTGTNNATIQFIQPRPMPNGRVMAMVTPFTNEYINNGDIQIINVNDYIDNDQPIWTYNGNLTGPAQSQVTVYNIHTDGTISPDGRIASAFPLWDGTSRMMLSWSDCSVIINNTEDFCTAANLADPNAVEAPPRFGLWLYNYGSLSTTGDDTQIPIQLPENGFMYTDVVVAQPRVPPPIIPETINPDWIIEQVGALHIRSVYDFGTGSFEPCDADNLGVLGSCTLPIKPKQNPSDPDEPVTSIAELADPANVELNNQQERPVRFLRISKMVGIPDPDDPTFNAPDLADSAFGPSRARGMREIIGYARVEPDGSVKVKVPANVPLKISLLDKDAQRIGPEHNFWLQVMPGETVECNGCHSHDTGVQPLPHGRRYAEAQTLNLGTTMAESRTTSDPDALIPTTDVVFVDDWTPMTPAAPFSYDYEGASGLTTQVPFSDPNKCKPWTGICRIVINYEDHISPLWHVVRVDGPDTDTAPDTCIDCHSSEVATFPDMDPSMTQLDLHDMINGTRTVSVDDPDVLKSYQELLVLDDNQERVGGVLQDVPPTIQVPGFDDQGNPIMITVPNGAFRNVGPYVNFNGANRGVSNAFFARFATGGTHEGRLTPAELRLIGEWLDIGAQNFNDPFDTAVPVN